MIFVLKNKISLLFLIFTLFLFASPAYANICDPKDTANYKPTAVDCGAGLTQIEDIFRNVISVVVGLGFIAMLIMIVMAGIKYLTSAGEPKAIQAAHQTLTWAILGIIFMAIAWLILQLIHTFTGIDVTIFNIKVLCGDPNNLNDPLKWFCKE